MDGKKGEKKKKKKKKRGKNSNNQGNRVVGGAVVGQRRSLSTTSLLDPGAPLPELSLSHGEAPVFELKARKHGKGSKPEKTLFKEALRGKAADVNSKYNRRVSGRLPCLQNALLAPLGSMWVSSPFDPDDTAKHLSRSSSATSTSLTLAGANSVVLNLDDSTQEQTDVPRWTAPGGLLAKIAPIRVNHYTMTPLPLPGRAWPRYNLPMRLYHYQTPPSKGFYACFVEEESFPIVPQTRESALLAHWWRGGV